LYFVQNNTLGNVITGNARQQPHQRRSGQRPADRRRRYVPHRVAAGHKPLGTLPAATHDADDRIIYSPGTAG